MTALVNDPSSHFHAAIARRLHIVAMALVLVATMLPAFDYGNGFGASYLRLGWEAAILAALGAVLGFVSGPTWWLAAVGSTLLNASVWVPLPRQEATGRLAKFHRLTTRVSGVAVVGVTTLLFLPIRVDQSYREGPTHLHTGAYVWLVAMWLNWLSRTQVAITPIESR